VAANDGPHVCASARRPLNRRHSQCTADLALPITASITTTEIDWLMRAIRPRAFPDPAGHGSNSLTVNPSSHASWPHVR
jgi:hypothetical protein